MGEMQFTGTQEEWEAFVILNKQNNMAQQIEPITIMVGNEEKIGCILMVYQRHPFAEDDSLKADILDKDGNILFTTIINAANVSEVAKQLNLNLLH
jgi:hypothetical protein